MIIPGPVVLVWMIFTLLINNSIVGDLMLLAFVFIYGVGFPFFVYTTACIRRSEKLAVYIKCKPFHRKWISFNSEDISKVEAATYSPIKEYGGWGIRYGRKGKGYNVSGNKGLFVTLRNGRNIMIGLANHEELYNLVNERLK
jgi:hypothetical protein